MELFGGSLDAIGPAGLAEIDITTDEAVKNTLEYIGSPLDEMIRLTEEIGE